jgi:predicted amidophosphoribosyltransferase
MRCAQCQFDNPPTMKFCVECGVPLAFLCPRCGTENQPTFKFCGQCGTSLIAAVPTDIATAAFSTPLRFIVSNS